MNSSDELNNEMLTAYFDGELSQAEQLQVEQALFDNPKLRQQLRDWATLRDAIQGASDSHVTGAESCSDAAVGSNSVAHDVSHLEKAIMNRIASAMAAGQVGWAATASKQAPRFEQKSSSASEVASGVGSGASGFSAASARGADIKKTSGHDLTDSLVNSQGDKDSSGGNWLSDYRRLSPTQRLSRWRWQLGAIFTVAAGLLLTVFLNQNFDFENFAYNAPTEKETDSARLSGISGPDLMVAKASPAPESMNGFNDPMLQNLAPGGAMPELFTADVNPAAELEKINTFFSYDVPDPHLGLQQMREVLDLNKMTPVEVFEQDDSPVLVLSGKVDELVKVLEAFQAIGGNSLALLAKVDSTTDSAMFPNVLQNYGGLPTQMEAMNLSAPSQLPQSMDSQANIAEKSESRQDQGDLIGEAQDPGLNISNDSLSQNAGQSPSQFPGGQGQQIASFNMRQQIAIGQIDMMRNLAPPPPDVDLAKFINGEVAEMRPRVPFGRQYNAQSQIGNLEPTPSNQAITNVPQAGNSTNLKIANDATAQAEPLANDHQQRTRQQIPGGGGGQAPGTTRSARGNTNPATQIQADSVEQAPALAAPGSSSQGDANSVAPNPSTTQIAVILRPKSRGQQQSSQNNQNQ